MKPDNLNIFFEQVLGKFIQLQIAFAIKLNFYKKKYTKLSRGTKSYSRRKIVVNNFYEL